MKEKKVVDSGSGSALRDRIALWEGRRTEPPSSTPRPRARTEFRKRESKNVSDIVTSSAALKKFEMRDSRDSSGHDLTKMPSVDYPEGDCFLPQSPDSDEYLEGSPGEYCPESKHSIGDRVDAFAESSSTQYPSQLLIHEDVAAVDVTSPAFEEFIYSDNGTPPASLKDFRGEGGSMKSATDESLEISQEEPPSKVEESFSSDASFGYSTMDIDGYRSFDRNGYQVPIRNEAVSNYWKQQTLKLELELKDEKVAALTREINDLNFTGKAEEEVAILKKAKHDLELRVKDQEEELDDLAGQVQMLEGARLRLEMSLEQMRKENRKEAQQREEEMEEVRLSAQKKVKAFEAQLESEHDERTQLLREKHELERRLALVQERTFASVDEDAFHRVKRELKKTKALLKDTQTMLEKTQSEGSNKLLLRQLKTQLEDAEFAKTAAIKARQSAESEASEVQSQLEEVLRAKNDAEERCVKHIKEKTEMQSQLEEGEEEVAEVMKKYKAAVSQLSIDQINIAEQTQIIAELEHDKQVLQERLSEMSSKVVVLEEETANIRTQSRLQMKIKELESKLELESTTRQRLDSQIIRLKDQLERLSSECDSAKAKEAQAFEFGKKLNRQLREAKEDLGNIQQKQTDAISKKQEIEKQYELAESEIITLKSDLKLAFKRIEDLQQALQGDLSDSDSELTDSESESETSLTSYLTTSVTQDRLRPNSSTHETASEGSSESKMMDLMVCSPTNDLMMSSIREDMEDDYKESFA